MATGVYPRTEEHLRILKLRIKLSTDRKSDHNYRPYFCECGCLEICCHGNRFIVGHNNKVRSEETNRKHSLAMMGHSPWNKGISWSEETKNKISQSTQTAMKHLSKEAKERMIEGSRKQGLANKGRIHSLETKRKNSESHKGKILSKEHKEKIKEACNSEIVKTKSRTAHMGMKQSESTVNKRRETIKKRYDKHEIGKKIAVALKGEKSHFWKGGITPIHHLIRDGIDAVIWREKIFSRDNWTCQKCKHRGGMLHAHHILNFADYPELRFDENNGASLCKGCHGEFHGLYGFQKNNNIQLGNYLELRNNG